MSNLSDGGSFSSGNTGEDEVKQHHQRQPQHLSTEPSASTTKNSNGSTLQQPSVPPVKKKRSLPGTPDPTAEVIALSPKALMTTNRFICEICNKGFQRDQNLQLHRRGHNLPWKLRQRTSTEPRKRVYICPEVTCVHHDPSRALGDLTGIKKHFFRKHGEKKWKCEKCSKKYAVQSDWKAHSKTCGTREYKCDCGTIFSRRDSFITHRAFCDALAEENRASQCLRASITAGFKGQSPQLMMPISGNTANNRSSMGMADFGHDMKNHLKALCQEFIPMPIKAMRMTDGGMFSSNSGPVFGACSVSSASAFLQLGGNNATVFDGPGGSSAHTSATVLLQKAAQMGATSSGSLHSPMMQQGFVTNMGSFGSMQAPGPYEQIQQSQMVGIDRQGTVLDTAPTGVFISSGNEGHAMLKNVEHESSGGMTKFMQRNGNAGLMAMAGRFGGGDTTEQQ